MSENLRSVSKKLVEIANLRPAQLHKEAKKANRKFVNAVSEIAYNILNGAVELSKSVKRKLLSSKLVQLLSSKKNTIATKQKALAKKNAAVVLKLLIAAALPVLISLRNG